MEVQGVVRGSLIARILAGEPADALEVVARAALIDPRFGVEFPGCIAVRICDRSGGCRQVSKGVVGITRRTVPVHVRQRGDRTQAVGVI